VIQVPDVKYWAKLAAPAGCAIYILASMYAYHGEEDVEKKIWRTIKLVMLQHTLLS